MATNRVGLTLVEVLAVVMVIMILLGLTTGIMTQATLSGEKSRARAELERIRAALEEYRSVHGTYPILDTRQEYRETWDVVNNQRPDRDWYHNDADYFVSTNLAELLKAWLDDDVLSERQRYFEDPPTYPGELTNGVYHWTHCLLDPWNQAYMYVRSPSDANSYYLWSYGPQSGDSRPITGNRNIGYAISDRYDRSRIIGEAPPGDFL